MTGTTAHPQTLHQELDDLLERYLELVDVYDRAQQDVQKYFARGFFSLAQANARSSIGRRYGADWYDDRTKATVVTEIVDSDRKVPQIKLVHRARYAASKAVQEGEALTEGQLPTPPQTPSVEPQDKSDQGQTAEKAVPAPSLQCDSLLWFGMLPSSHLRAAQAAFKLAVHEETTGGEATSIAPIQHAFSAARELRSLAVDIRRLRKNIRQAEKSYHLIPS